MRIVGRILIDLGLVIVTLVVAFLAFGVVYTYTNNGWLSLVIFFVLLMAVPYGVKTFTDRRRPATDVTAEQRAYQKWGPKFMWGCLILIAITEFIVYIFTGKLV